MSSQKLWIAYETPEMTYGPTRVSIDGCDYVAHLLNKLYEGPLLGIPKDFPVTLYQPDGKTYIKTTVTLKSLQDVGKDADAPLIVKTVVQVPKLGDAKSMYDILSRFRSKPSRYTDQSYHRTNYSCELKRENIVPPLSQLEREAILDHANTLWMHSFRGVTESVQNEQDSWKEQEYLDAVKNQDFFNKMLGSVLKQMSLSKMTQRSIVTEESIQNRVMWHLIKTDNVLPWGWANLSVSKLQWRSMINTSTDSVVVLGILGKGADGKVVLVANKKGQVSAMKLLRTRMEEGRLVQMEQDAREEAQNWTCSQIIEKMDQITTEINKFNSKIDAIEQQLKKPFKAWTEGEKEGFGNHEQLREERKQLRELLILKEKENQQLQAIPSKLPSDITLPKLGDANSMYDILLKTVSLYRPKLPQNKLLM
ncbi:hypothetical protein HDV02_003179 [Globomyces sp. JEL0801]|nr:hypothetical protein HDV02_003179 [Globomyces sp. JEL0801]